jgi:hypothetical protein
MNYRIIEMNSVLDILSIPSVLVNIINSYVNSEYELVHTCNIPKTTIFVIDNAVYIRDCTKKLRQYYIHNYGTLEDTEINYLSSYKQNEYMISFKYNVTIYNSNGIEIPHYINCGYDNFDLRINDRDVTEFLFAGFNFIGHVREFRICGSELYVSAQYDKYNFRYIKDMMNVYKINLCERQCVDMEILPYGRIYVSKSYIFINNRNGLHMYDKQYKKRCWIMKHIMKHVIHITDTHIYGEQIQYTKILSVVQIDKPEQVYEITSFDQVWFGDNIFCVANSNKYGYKLNVYKINV